MKFTVELEDLEVELLLESTEKEMTHQSGIPNWNTRDKLEVFAVIVKIVKQLIQQGILK